MKTKKRNNFVKRNIVRFFVVIVLATVFGGCTKYETYISETKIVETRVSDIDFTTVDLIIVLSGNTGIVGGPGLEINGYFNDFTYSWYDIGRNENWDMEYGIHLEGLLPGATYRCRPYIKRDDIIVYGEYQVFTTKR